MVSSIIGGGESRKIHGVAHRELMPDVIHDNSQHANNLDNVLEYHCMILKYKDYMVEKG
jgi:hypothetical protein